MNPWHRLAAFSMVCMLGACSPKDSDADSNPSSGSATGSGGSGGSSGSNGGGIGGASGQGGKGGSGGTSRGGASAGAFGASAGGGNGGAAGSSTGGGSGGGGAVDAGAMVEDMGFGTNIGNTLENTASWETGWGQPPVTRAFIDGIASRGIKTVRVPVAWDTYASNGIVDPSHLARVKEVVGWIVDAGLYAIVNIHWDGGWIFNEHDANQYRLTDDVKSKFTSYWQQIASDLGDVGHHLILEGLNEEGRFYVNGDPEQAPDYAALNQLNQLFVTTVRAQGGYNTSRALLIAGFNTDIELTCVDAFQVPADPAGPGKLFLSLHYYTPSTFTLLETVASWGSPATVWGSGAEKAELQSLFEKAASFSSAKKIPIILGEFAVTRGENYVREPDSRVLWMESVAEAAMSRGMVPVLWDTGSEIERGDGSFSPELESVMDQLN